MRRRTTLLLLVLAVGGFLFYLRSLVQSPLTTATSLETSSPTSSTTPPLGLVFAVENPDLERTGDFTIRPTPIRCSLIAVRVPKLTIDDPDGSLALADTASGDLVVSFGSDTASVPQRALQLVFRLRPLLNLATDLSVFPRSGDELDVPPLDLASVLDRNHSALEDADSGVFNVLGSFVTPLHRPFLYPFDSYELTLAASIHAKTPIESRTFPPSLSILCDRSGWTHQVSFPHDTTRNYTLANVVFRRAPDVRIVAILALATLVLLILAIPFQRDTGSVLEVSFSFLLGLWGIKSVLVPTSVRYPTIVDSALVGLFALFTFSVLLRLVLSPLASDLRPRLGSYAGVARMGLQATSRTLRVLAQKLLESIGAALKRTRGSKARRPANRRRRPPGDSGT